jgi:hypothetical protein
VANPATRVGRPIAALLLRVSGLFGGLDHVPLADRVDDVKPGTEVTVEPFTLTIKQAVAVDQIGDVISPLTPGNHLMVVLVGAENQSKESVGSPRAHKRTGDRGGYGLGRKCVGVPAPLSALGLSPESANS